MLLVLLPTKPTYWHSMLLLKLQEQVTMDVVFQLSQMKCRQLAAKTQESLKQITQRLNQLQGSK